MINPKFGYYQIDGNVFSLKEDMFDHIIANYTEQQIQSIKWDSLYNFSNDMFNSIDWTIDPPFTMDELYRLRAQKLREEYDYLILMFSGGSDSTQILNTFLNHNIFIDEIQTYSYEKVIKKVDSDIYEKVPQAGIMLEYEYAAKPILEKVAKLSPKTKINVIDTSDYSYDQIVNKKYDFIGNKSHPGFKIVSVSYQSHNPYSVVYNQKNVPGDKKVAFIRGYEKPNLTTDSNYNLYFSFSDMPYVSIKLLRMGLYEPSFVIEDFYWSPDGPLIPVKQCHLIAKKLKEDDKYKKTFFAFLNNNSVARSYFKTNYNFYRRMIDPIVYPNWVQTFSAPKTTFLGRNDETGSNPEFELFKHLGYKVQAYSQNKAHTTALFERYKKIPINYIDDSLYTKKHFIGNFKEHS